MWQSYKDATFGGNLRIQGDGWKRFIGYGTATFGLSYVLKEIATLCTEWLNPNTGERYLLPPTKEDREWHSEDYKLWKICNKVDTANKISKQSYSDYIEEYIGEHYNSNATFRHIYSEKDFKNLKFRQMEFLINNPEYLDLQ